MKKTKKRLKTKRRLRNKKSHKTSKKKTVRRSKTKLPVVTEEKLTELARRGRSRGFVTESEIIQTFPNIEEDISGLERLYSKLESLSIKVVGAQERLTLEPVGKERLKKPEGPAGLGPLFDSVQIYLREIGKVALLRG